MGVGNNNPPYLGYDSYVAVAEETIFGTYVTATAFVEFNSEGFKREEEEIKLPAINNTRDYTKRMKGKTSISGSLEVPMNVASDAIVYMVKQAMGGTCASSQVVASCYNHTFYTGDMESNKATSTASDHKSLSVQVRKGNTAQWTFKGMRVNTMTLKGEVGSPITASFEMIGKDATSTTDSLTSSFTTQLPLNFTGVTVQTGATTTSMTTEYVSAFEFTLNNNLAEQRALGSALIHSAPPIKCDVSIKLTQQFDTITNYNRFIQNTETMIKIILDTAVTIAAAGSTTYSMHIDCPACYFNNVMPAVGGSDALTQEMNLTAIRNTSTGYAVQIKVNNATASYL
jgi:hypothetical protein